MDNMEIAKVLLSVQMDDLSDAEKLTDYADKVKHCGDAGLARILSTRAQKRLEQMEECEQHLNAVMQRMEDLDGQTSGAMYGDMLKDYLYRQKHKVMTKLSEL